MARKNRSASCTGGSFGFLSEAERTPPYRKEITALVKENGVEGIASQYVLLYGDKLATMWRMYRIDRIDHPDNWEIPMLVHMSKLRNFLKREHADSICNPKTCKRNRPKMMKQKRKKYIHTNVVEEKPKSESPKDKNGNPILPF